MRKYKYIILDLTRPLKVTNNRVLINVDTPERVVQFLSMMEDSKYVILKYITLTVKMVCEHIEGLAVNIANNTIAFNLCEEG